MTVLVTPASLPVMLRPNAPKMVTVLVAVALTVIGLSLTVFPIDAVTDLLREAGIKLTQEQKWLALAASPTLLIVASFIPNL